MYKKSRVKGAYGFKALKKKLTRFCNRFRPFLTVPETARNGERYATLYGQEPLGTFES
jgi:hypothetical protein